MSEIHSKISLDRFLPFPLSIDFDFYLLATQVFDYTRNYTDFIGKVGRPKSWKPGRLQTRRRF